MAILAPNVLKYELRREIKMRYPLETDEIIELADLYGTNKEMVVHAIDDYEKEKAKEKDEYLTGYVKDVLHNMDLSVEKPSPTFEEFYKAFEDMYGISDDEFTKNDIQKKFLELTTDKKQLKLFEIRSVVRKLISEQINSDSLHSTIQKAHHALKRFDMMAPKEIITPGMVQGWANIHQELSKELENAREENLPLLQKLKFIFNELVMEKGIIRQLDKEAISGYVEDAKKFLQNKNI
jgi:hypothetical protein